MLYEVIPHQTEAADFANIRRPDCRQALDKALPEPRGPAGEVDPLLGGNEAMARLAEAAHRNNFV